MKILSDIFLIALAVAAAWWLSGYDSKLIGDNGTDILRRCIRCGVSFLLTAILFFLPRDITSLPILFAVGGLLALTWAGCATEFFSHGFHRLTGMAGTSHEFDPNENARNMHTLARLIQNGRHEEALQWCETLKASGDVNPLVLETLLGRAGVPHENFKMPKPLAEAHRLRTEGKFAEAETILKSLLAENPANAGAALMLMRLYVQDFRRSDKAAEILRALEKQPHISAAQIEYATRSVHDWGRKKIEPKVERLPESVDELLAAGYLGTAIEQLEQKAKEQPDDFETQLKLAEAYGLHSGNLPRAKKIVEAMDDKFSEEQLQTAKAKLDEWRK